MKNVKDRVYAALCTVSENVSDAYPRSWAEGSTIQYTEEQNDVYEASSDAEGMKEDKALVRYRIDIWNNHSTSEAALQVDEAMKVTGLKRIACADVPDPSGMKHKQMADGESIKIYNAKHVTSGGHLVFDSDGSTVAYLSSSAKRYKNHLSNMTLDEAEKILDIPVVWFNYKEGYLAEDDQMNGKPVPGMYAEDVAKYYPVGAYNNEEGLVENWNERMIIPAMLKLLQNLYKRIS